MLLKLIFLFTLIPLIEFMLLIRLGHLIGVGNTIVIVLLTGTIGAYLAREQGFFIFQKIKNELNQGILPADSLIDSILIFAGSLLLITPGVITDIVGFLIIIPRTRKYLRIYVKQKFQQKINPDQIYTDYKVE